MSKLITVKAPITTHRPTTFVFSDGIEVKINHEGKTKIDPNHLKEALSQGFVVEGEKNI